MQVVEKCAIAALVRYFDILVRDSKPAGEEGPAFWRPLLGSVGLQAAEIDEIVSSSIDRAAGSLSSILLEADALCLSSSSRAVVPDVVQPLSSIFQWVGGVKPGEPDGEDRGLFYSPRTTDLADSTVLNPVPARDESPASAFQRERERTAAKLRESLRTAAGLLEGRSTGSLLETLYSLMGHYLSRIGLGTGTVSSTVSVFDHARSVAAISGCLVEAGDEPEPFLFIKGDISGIQAFLYNLAGSGGHRGMSKRLRGRSLFIQLLTRSVARFFLERLSLPRTQLLFEGGGHFLLVVPNSSPFRVDLDKASREVHLWLLRQYEAGLGLALASVPVSREEVTGFAQVQDRLGSKLAEEKSRLFSSLFSLDPHEVFGPIPSRDGHLHICPVCRGDASGIGDVCSGCDSHQRMGQRMPKAGVLVGLRGTSVDRERHPFLNTGPEESGWTVCTTPEDLHALLQHARKPEGPIQVCPLKSSLGDFLKDPHWYAVLRETSLDIALSGMAVADHAPLDDGEDVLEFEDLAENSEGASMLGTLRADVDFLGTVFRKGLPDSFRTLAHYSTLSRELEIFFSRRVNALAEEYGIYVVYSGGDDLCVVGPWNRIIGFSQGLRTAFREWTCGNSHLGISAGIFLSHDHFPLGRMVEFAGNEEDRAKRQDPEQKDRISCFGQVHTWKRFGELIDYGKDLCVLIKQDALPRSFVHFLITMYRESFGPDGRQDVDWIRRIRPALHYHIARRGANRQALDEDSDQLKIKTLGRLIQESDLMEDIVVPSAYALYLTRDRSRHRKEKWNAGAATTQE